MAIGPPIEDGFYYDFDLVYDDYRARLGINDPESEKCAGSPDMWEKGIKAIQNAADHVGIDYTVEVGEATFCGPKLDFILRDVLK